MQNRTLRRAGALVALVVGVIYLLNPTAGILELIPDVTPVIGNLDEAGATALVIWAIQQMRQGTAVPIAPPPSRFDRQR